MTDYNIPTIYEAHQLLKNKQVSSAELTRNCLERIKKVEPQVKALVTVTEEMALKQAQHADKLIAAGEEIHPLFLPG